jgi:hypothetical protein
VHDGELLSEPAVVGILFDLEKGSEELRQMSGMLAEAVM